MNEEITDWSVFYDWVSAPLDWVTPSDWVKVEPEPGPFSQPCGYKLAAQCNKCGRLKAVINERGDLWHAMKETCEHTAQEPNLEAVNKAARKPLTKHGRAPYVRV